MSLKPTILRKVSTDPAAMAEVIGPKFGSRFFPNPDVAEYAIVIKFPSNGVVSGRAVAKALKKLSEPKGPILLAGYDFTVEARQMAQTEACDLVSMAEFGWTDALYADRMLGKVQIKPLRSEAY
jgi:hypothetical protein